MGTFVLSQDGIIVESAFTFYLKQTKWINNPENNVFKIPGNKLERLLRD